MEGTLSEYAFYLLFPCSLLVGLLCLAKHIIRRTEFFHNDDSLEGKTIVVTGKSYWKSLERDISDFVRNCAWRRVTETAFVNNEKYTQIADT